MMTVEGAHIASEFLKSMFGASTAAPVYICSLPNSDAEGREVGERHVATRDPEHVEAFRGKWDRKDRGLYFAVATVKAGATARKKETLDELNCLHVDIDFKSVINAGPVEIERRLRETMCLPSFVTLSGNGLHAYWCFRESLPASDENIARVEALLRLLADHLGGDPACAEASRLMRLPGSHNSKDGAWKEVPILVNEPTRRYEIDDLTEWLEVVSPIIHRKPTDGSNGHDVDAANPWLTVAGRFGNKPPIDVEARLAAMQYRGAVDSGIHATQVSVSAALLNRGQPIDEVIDILLTATRTAAGQFGERWNWRREERAIRSMCEGWIIKHPEVKDQIAQPNTVRDKTVIEAPAPLRWLDMSNWDYELRPEREWAIPDRVPLNQAGLFSGEGGAGKSIIEMMKDVAHVAGKEWLGSRPEIGPAIYLGAEDDEKEIHIRFYDIAEHYGVTFNDLITGGLRVLCMLGQDATLCALTRNSKVETTAFYRQLYEAAGDIKPKNISIDTLSRAFAGNEIDRVQVYAFAMHMQALAMVARGSVTVLSHPSLQGISSGSGISGSTAWHGAFRFRQYLKGGPNDEAGETPDRDLRQIEFKKNQYGPSGDTIVLRYQRGLFLPVAATGGLEKLAEEQRHDQLFLELLDKFQSQGRNVSHTKTAHSYAPTQFSKDPKAKAPGIYKAMADAMERLFAAKKIKVKDYGRPSNPHRRIVRYEEE
jgi:RecA-family ATPase